MNRLFILLLLGLVNCSIFFGKYTLPVSGYEYGSLSYHDVNYKNLTSKRYRSALPTENLDSLLYVSLKNFYFSANNYHSTMSININMDIEKHGMLSNIIIQDSTLLSEFEKQKIQKIFSNMLPWSPARKLFPKKSTLILKFRVKTYRTVLKDYFTVTCSNLEVTPSPIYKSKMVKLPLIQESNGQLSLPSLFYENEGINLNGTSRDALDSLVKNAPRTISLLQNEKTITLRIPFKLETTSNIDSEPTQKQTDNIYFANDITKLPRFKGSLFNYLSFNLRKLKAHPSNKKNGSPFSFNVQFIVEKNGTVEKVTIPKKHSVSLNQDTIDIIIETFTNMEWSPGQKDNQPVRVRMIQPITITP